MPGTACPRCEQPDQAARWCEACGLDLRPGEPVLPTPAAQEAGMRDSRWLADHPDVADRERAQRDRAAAEQALAEVARREQEQPSLEEYRSREWLSHLTRRWIGLVVIVTLVTAAFEAAHLSLLDGLAAGDYPDSPAVLDSEARIAVAYLVLLVAWVVAGVLFVAWTFRAYKNVQALGARDMRFGNGWAIGGWFVPILSLWRPKQVIDDVWRSADPDLPPTAPAYLWIDGPIPRLLTAWWVVWVGATVLGWASARVGMGTLSTARIGFGLDLVASVVQAVAGVLAMRVVFMVTRRLRNRADKVSAPAGPT
jgi:hypothetical protein